MALDLETIRLSGCATVTSDRVGAEACPPVVVNSRQCKAPAAEQPAPLPEGSAAAELSSDYGVMRHQARVDGR